MVQNQPWQRPLVISAVALIGVLSVVLGYAVGQNERLAKRLGTGQPDQLEQMQLQMDDLQSDLIDARLAADVQRTAAQALRVDLTKMREQMQRLNEELTFYKSLMAPGSLVKGLQVTELELTNRRDPQIFGFELLLTQVAQRRTYISGQVRLDIIGHHEADSGTSEGDPEVVLSLTEVSDVESYPLKFKFRYFQDLSGELTLPEGFLPGRVMITAQQNGKDAIQESFPWPQW
ncbi:MAG: DUF6776 family protein [Pseudomonadota bacterium]